MHLLAVHTPEGDGHLVDDDVVAAQPEAGDVSQNREEDDQGGNREPGQLAPAQSAQHEIVHRADDDDVEEDEEKEPERRGQDQRREAGHSLPGAVAVARSLCPGRRLGKLLDDAFPQLFAAGPIEQRRGVRVQRQIVDGAAPVRQTRQQRQAVFVQQRLAGAQVALRHEVGAGIAERGAELQAEGRQIVYRGAAGWRDGQILHERCRRLLPARAAGNDQLPAERHPGSQGLPLGRRQPPAIYVGEDEHVKAVPGRGCFRKLLDAHVGHRRVAPAAGHVLQQVERYRLVAHHAIEQGLAAQPAQWHLHTGDRIAALVHQQQIEIAGEAGHVDVQGDALVGLGRQADRTGVDHPVIRRVAACRHAQLAFDRFPAIRDGDVDRNPLLLFVVAIEAGDGGERQPVAFLGLRRRAAHQGQEREKAGNRDT